MRRGEHKLLAAAVSALLVAGVSSAPVHAWEDESVELLVDLMPGAAGSQHPGSTGRLGEYLYFTGKSPTAFEGYADSELWRTDGTDAGTQIVKNINSTPGAGSFPGGFTRLGGSLYFAATDSTHGFELWRTDGTGAGTAMVKDINTSTEGVNNQTNQDAGVSGLVEFEGRLFFSADDSRGARLWMTDGTPEGTKPVGSLGGDGGPFNPHDLTVVGDQLLFAANDSAHGYELWRSDGTIGGTSRVKDIKPGYPGSEPLRLTEFNGELYFAAGGYGEGNEFWKSDGSSAGTLRISDAAGEFVGYPDNLEEVAGTLYFTALGEPGGTELWRTDGTSAGTRQVSNIWPTGDADPAVLTEVNGNLFFIAEDGSEAGRHGRELWRSDGTQAGTVLVKDILPGPYDAFPGPWDLPPQLTAFQDTLVFSADDGALGEELWVSDGTRSGTVVLKDISPGSGRSYPSRFDEFRGSLLFIADDGSHGSELWHIRGQEPEVAMPDTVITAGPENNTTVTATDESFSFAASTGSPTVLECKLDGGWFTRCVSPHVFAGLAPGPHTAYFRAVDGLGYADPTPAQRAFSVEAAPTSPTIQPSNEFVVSGGAADTTKGTLRISLTTPGDGTVWLTRSGRSPVRSVTKAVERGSTRLTLRLTARGQKRLEQDLQNSLSHGGAVGRLKVKVTLTYAPSGGSPRSERHTFVFKLR